MRHFCPLCQLLVSAHECLCGSSLVPCSAAHSRLLASVLAAVEDQGHVRAARQAIGQGYDRRASHEEPRRSLQLRLGPQAMLRQGERKCSRPLCCAHMTGARMTGVHMHAVISLAATPPTAGSGFAPRSELPLTVLPTGGRHHRCPSPIASTLLACLHRRFSTPRRLWPSSTPTSRSSTASPVREGSRFCANRSSEAPP